VKALKNARGRKNISQRDLARLAGVSFRTIQLVESQKHNATLATLQNVAKALGYPAESVAHRIESLFSQPVDSIAIISERLHQGEDWKIWFFNFVDAFRRAKDPAYVENPPDPDAPPRMKALLASAVEVLCEELGLPVPFWCAAIPSLAEPWFVSETENLKAMALVESPVHFRKRNIFVFENFLKRV